MIYTKHNKGPPMIPMHPTKHKFGYMDAIDSTHHNANITNFEGVQAAIPRQNII